MLTFAGVGNISGQIYSGAQAGQHLVSVNGTAGHQMQRIREFSYPWPDDGMLVMHSDGLSTHTGLEKHPGLALHDPSLIAGVLYRDFTRRNDDATVVVAKVALRRESMSLPILSCYHPLRTRHGGRAAACPADRPASRLRCPRIRPASRRQSPKLRVTPSTTQAAGGWSISWRAAPHRNCSSSRSPIPVRALPI